MMPAPASVEVLGAAVADLNSGYQVQGSADFQLYLNRQATRFLGFAWPRLNGGWRAWAPFALRRLRVFHTRSASHLELADDVISTLYDPQQLRNQSAVFGLGHVPEYGLMQTYGGIADAPEPAQAVQQAVLGSLRLVAALLGRYRQSQFLFFDPDEGTAYYEHLHNCRYTAALIGQMVPRRAPGAGGMNSSGLPFMATKDAQEQLEVLCGAMGSQPWAMLSQVEPLFVTDIRRLYIQTAEVLSHHVSQVRTTESANLMMSAPMFINPVAASTQQTYRGTEIAQGERRQFDESAGHRLASGQSVKASSFAQTLKSAATHAGQEVKTYGETQRIGERIAETESARVALQREYSEAYTAQKTYAGSEAGSMSEAGTQRLTETGHRGQQLGEQGQMQSVEGQDEAIRGNRYGAGGRSESTAFSESAAYAGGSTRQWSGTYDEASQRTFDHSGQDHEATRYQDARQTVGSEQVGEAFDRQQTLDQRAQAVQQETYAQDGQVARITPGGMGMNAGVVQETGTRGAIGDNALNQTTDLAGSGNTVRDTNAGAVETGARVQDTDYQRAGVQDEALARQWTGNERTATSEWRSGGGTRSSSTGYGFSEAYGDTRRVDRTSDRAWESEVDSDATWQQEVSGAFARQSSFSRAFSGSLDEAGSRAGTLVQNDVLNAERTIARNVGREIAGTRTEATTGELQREEAARGQAYQQEAMIGEGREYATAVSASQAGGIGANAGMLQVTSRGMAGPSGGGLMAGLNFGRENIDATQRLLAALLELQVERFRVGVNTGLFLTQVTLMAPDAATLERLNAAAIAAFREEEGVVAPAAIRDGDAQLWQCATRMEFDPRKEPVPMFDTYQHAQVLTSNEVAALTHPVRLSTGTISASLDAWPEKLSRRHTRGALPLGELVDINIQPDPTNVHRLSRAELMHTVIVGDSGSGKTNSAFWIMAQIIRRLREDEAGNPLPVTERGGLDQPSDAGRPAIGAVIFDPTGEWRKLGRLIPPADFRFHSLTEPDYHHLAFNPLYIPSPHIDPPKWAAALAKHWLLAYPAGGTAFNILKGAVLDVYRQLGVIDAQGGYHTALSAGASMTNLHAALGAKLDELKRTREDNISAGVAKRIYDKLDEFLAGGVYYRAYGQAGGTGVTDWVDPHRATVITGKFGDDGPLKQFIIGLMVSGIYLHADGAYDYYLRQGLPIPETLIFVEEAHVVMRSDAASQTETAQAIGEDAGLWNNITDRGRKLGLFLFTSAQHWVPLPAGVVSSTALVIAQKTSTLEDTEIAVPKLGQLPGKTSIDEYSRWTTLLLNLPMGVGLVRRTRKTLGSEEEMEIFPVQFFDLSHIQPPNDVELDQILSCGGQL